MKAKLDEVWCYQILREMRWPKGIACPFCERRRVTTHSKFGKTPRRRYLCLSCHRTFSDLTGTPMARTNLSLGKWFLCSRLIEEGGRTSELAKELGVKWDTAAHMQRRLNSPGLVRNFYKMVKEGQLA
jgi:transposase-like protein